MTEPDIPTHTHSSGGGSLSGALTKKIGPAPGWVWVVVIVGALYGYRWYKGRNGTPVVTDPTLADTSTSPTANIADTGGTAGGAGIFTPPVLGSTPSGPSTTAEWAALAVKTLIAGGTNPTDANNAVTTYVSHGALSTTQQTIINKVLAQLGPPPEGLIPVVKAPPGPQYGPFAYITLTGNETLGSLSTHYYGSTGAWQHIQNYNANLLSHGYTMNQKLPKGLHIRIPLDNPLHHK